ncbi:hypothetical protein [Aureibacillus halotolerans]|uniref:Cellulose synthase subunit n=1 Tax=Aureibacillus halotolerans TaxID=1508390 RepID=A0A4V3D5J7_9BACI|nr:hypothetical protein [Aureibacillus halotolerans]TDQ40347.1 hypothetical protein EV213_10663 [Aureibacillus halotolerans]
MYKRWSRMVQWLSIIFVLALSTGQANAQEADINVTLEEGIDGLVRPEHGFPIKVTLENTSGRNISGDLAILLHPRGVANQSVIKAVDLPAETTKTVNLSLPNDDLSYQYSSNNGTVLQQVQFYENGWRNGTETPLSGDLMLTNVQGTMDDVYVGIYSTDPDAYPSLKQYSASSQSMLQLLTMTEEDFPESSLGLDMLNMIFVDQVSIQTLSEEQQQAIIAWVRQGGVFVAGGDPAAATKLGGMSAFLPLQSGAALPANPAIFPGVEMIQGDLHPEASYVSSLGTPETPLAASRDVGSGAVVQLFFSPAAVDFSAWEEVGATFWNDLMSPHAVAMNDDRYYLGNVQRAASLFPAQTLPVWGISLVVALFVIAVFPLSYFLLKRLDKREHMWWIVPVVSLVICLMTFVIGAKDRLAGTEVNEASIIDLHPHGTATGYGSIAYLTSNGGDKAYKVNQQLQNVSTNAIGQFEGAHGAVQYGQESTSILYKDTGFWSIYGVNGDVSLSTEGSLKGDLKREGSQLFGELVNETNLTFTQMYLLTGNQTVPLGAVGAGDTLQLDASVDTILMGAPTMNAFQGLTSLIDASEQIKQSQVEAMMNAKQNMVNNRTKKTHEPMPVLVGISQDRLYSEGEHLDVTAMHLVFQPINVEETLQGEVKLNNTNLTLSVDPLDEASEVHYIESYSVGVREELYVSAGTFQFTYQLPPNEPLDRVTWQELTIEPDTSMYGSTFSIYNRTTETWEDLGTFAELPAGDYLSDEGSIELKLVTTEEISAGLPQVELIGEGKND